MVFLLLIVGLVVLLLAGDFLVKGSVSLALRAGLPMMLVGMVVVGFGTSLPELFVSVEAALGGFSGIAIGNVVGSNIVNILLILGLPAIITPIATDQCDLKSSYFMMLTATLIFMIGAFLGPITVWHGIIFLSFTAIALFSMAQKAKANKAPIPEELEEADPSMPIWKIGIFILLGLVGLPLGAHIFIGSATEIARHLGASEAAIGLTLVALGTSLPELASTTMAAIRRHTELAIGNVIGSNIFNLMAVIGVTSLIADLKVPGEILVFDIWILLATALFLMPFALWKLKMSRLVGAFLCGLYVIYCSLVLFQGV